MRFQPGGFSAEERLYVPYIKPAVPDEKFNKEFKPVLLDTEDKLMEVISGVEGKTIGADTETNTLDFSAQGPLVGISFSFSPYDGYYCPFRHLVGNNLPPRCMGSMNEFLAKNNLLMFNALFDLMMLKAEGFSIDIYKVFEVMSLVFNVDTNVKKNGLKWSCFVGGTLINVVGGERPIGRVQRGDLVLVGDRSFKVRFSGSRGVRKVIRVKLEGGEEITCTPDHLFVCRRGRFWVWRRAKELLGEDLVTGRDVLKMGEQEKERFYSFLIL